MRNIMLISEYINNKDNMFYLFNKLKDDIIEKFPENKITFEEEPIGVKQMFYFNIFGEFIPKDTIKIKKILKNWVEKFDRNDLFLSFKEKTYLSNDNRLKYYYKCVIKTHKVKRVKPPKYIYHTANINKRDFILNNGLIPVKNNNYVNTLDHPPVVFASINKDNLFMYNENKDLWLIDTSNLNNKWYVDLNMNTLSGYKHDDFIMTFDKIPPENIKLLKK